jgi:hypothetical protein
LLHIFGKFIILKLEVGRFIIYFSTDLTKNDADEVVSVDVSVFICMKSNDL